MGWLDCGYWIAYDDAKFKDLYDHLYFLALLEGLDADFDATPFYKSSKDGIDALLNAKFGSIRSDTVYSATSTRVTPTGTETKKNNLRNAITQAASTLFNLLVGPVATFGIGLTSLAGAALLTVGILNIVGVLSFSLTLFSVAWPVGIIMAAAGAIILAAVVATVALGGLGYLAYRLRKSAKAKKRVRRETKARELELDQQILKDAESLREAIERFNEADDDTLDAAEEEHSDHKASLESHHTENESPKSDRKVYETGTSEVDESGVSSGLSNPNVTTDATSPTSGSSSYGSTVLPSPLKLNQKGEEPKSPPIRRTLSSSELHLSREKSALFEDEQQTSTGAHSAATSEGSNSDTEKTVVTTSEEGSSDTEKTLAVNPASIQATSSGTGNTFNLFGHSKPPVNPISKQATSSGTSSTFELFDGRTPRVGSFISRTGSIINGSSAFVVDPDGQVFIPGQNYPVLVEANVDPAESLSDRKHSVAEAAKQVASSSKQKRKEKAAEVRSEGSSTRKKTKQIKQDEGYAARMSLAELIKAYHCYQDKMQRLLTRYTMLKEAGNKDTLEPRIQALFEALLKVEASIPFKLNIFGEPEMVDYTNTSELEKKINELYSFDGSANVLRQCYGMICGGEDEDARKELNDKITGFLMHVGTFTQLLTQIQEDDILNKKLIGLNDEKEREACTKSSEIYIDTESLLIETIQFAPRLVLLHHEIAKNVQKVFNTYLESYEDSREEGRKECKPKVRMNCLSDEFFIAFVEQNMENISTTITELVNGVSKIYEHFATRNEDVEPKSFLSSLGTLLGTKADSSAVLAKFEHEKARLKEAQEAYRTRIVAMLDQKDSSIQTVYEAWQEARELVFELLSSTGDDTLGTFGGQPNMVASVMRNPSILWQSEESSGKKEAKEEHQQEGMWASAVNTVAYYMAGGSGS